MSQLRIKLRLLLGFGAVVLILMSLSGSLYALLHGIQQHAESMQQVALPKSEAAQRLSAGVTQIRLAVLGLLQDGDAAAIRGKAQLIDKADADVKRAINSIEQLQPHLRVDPQEQRHLGLLKSRYAAALVTVREVAQLYRDDTQRESARLLFKTDVEPSLRIVQQALDAYLQAESGRSKGRVHEIGAATERALGLLLAASLLALIVSVLVAWAVTRSIVRPMGELADSVARVAQGDLGVEMRVVGRDEVAEVQTAVRGMVAALSDVIAETQRTAHHLTDAARALAHSASLVRRGSEAQADSSTVMASALEQITVSINHVSALAGEARTASSDSGAQAEQGAQAIGHVAGQVDAIVATVQQAADEMHALDDSCSGIAQIVDVIRDLADQTNLLALNAAIEAARAGEQGRGFAVVADEVRQLAEKTTLSAHDITRRVGTIRAGSASLAGSMALTIESVRQGMERARHATTVVAGAHAASGSVLKLIDEVDSALREQAAATNDTARRVEQVVQMAAENSRAISLVAGAADELTRLADGLVDSVARFRVLG